MHLIDLNLNSEQEVSAVNEAQQVMSKKLHQIQEDETLFTRVSLEG